MTFVDTNVFMYAVGRQHPLRSKARGFFIEAVSDETSRLVTSAEVLQELLHAYHPVGRLMTLRHAFDLVLGSTHEVWPIEADDVRMARGIAETHVGVGARDALHIACCRRRDVDTLKTFDRGLEVAFSSA